MCLYGSQCANQCLCVYLQVNVYFVSEHNIFETWWIVYQYLYELFEGSDVFHALGARACAWGIPCGRVGDKPCGRSLWQTCSTPCRGSRTGFAQPCVGKAAGRAHSCCTACGEGRARLLWDTEVWDKRQQAQHRKFWTDIKVFKFGFFFHYGKVMHWVLKNTQSPLGIEK